MPCPHWTFSLGLVGKRLDYSFSRDFFLDFFKTNKIDFINYQNFEVPDAEKLTHLFQIPGLVGFNVTVPYKEAILKHLEQLIDPADQIRAVNCVVKHPEKQKWIGYNTDWIGAKASLNHLLGFRRQLKKALILGTGATARTFHYVLLHFWEVEEILFVSRTPASHGSYVIGYDEVENHIEQANLIINTTPVGTYPNVEEKPRLPYEKLHSNLALMDVVYNPPKTAFLQEGEKRGIPTLNGHLMLEVQAYASWAIWNGYYRWSN